MEGLEEGLLTADRGEVMVKDIDIDQKEGYNEDL